jgi:phage portal protein BeeE
MIKIENLKFNKATLSSFSEVIGRNVPFISWGADNQFVNELYLLNDASPIQNACIRSKVDNCVGMGYVNDYQINLKEKLNDVAKKMFYEFITTGNLFLECIWKQDRSQGLASIHVIPSRYMRLHKPEEIGGEVTKYLYCRDWLNWRKAGMVEFSELNPKNFTDRQIVHIKNYQSGYDYYGACDWLSCINDVRLNHEITVFNLSNIQNGLSPSLWVHFNVPAPDSQQEQNQILQNIENRYMGSENAGRVIVSYGESEQKPDITQIQSSVQDGYFSSIFDLVQKQIMSGHKIIDGSLIGLPNPGGFTSSADQLETAYKLFMSTSIKPIQTFMNRELKPILELMYPGQEISLVIEQNNII